MFMSAYDDLAGAEPSSYFSMFLADSDQDLKLAQLEATFDAQVGMLQRIVRLKWGDGAVGQVIHALGMHAAVDIQSAEILIDGDRAKIQYADGTAGPDLVRTAVGWRLDTSAFRKSLAVPVDQYANRIHQLANVVAEVADAIDRRQLRNADTVSHEIAVRVVAVDQTIVAPTN